MAEDNPRRWYKGDLHFHCERSTMAEMLATYQRRGYDFCISTEHDAVYDVATHIGSDGLCRLNSSDGLTRQPLLLIPGSEMSLTIPRGPGQDGPVPDGMPAHLGAYPLADPVEKQSPAWVTLAGLRQRPQPPIVTVNHPLAGGTPDRKWGANTVLEAIAHGVTHMELNPRNHGIEAALLLWDEVLTAGHHLIGVLTNDAHETGNIGRYGSTMVRANTLTAAAILEGLRQGDCYALESGSRARLRRYQLTGGAVTIAVTGAQELHFIGSEGRTRHIAYSEDGQYQPTGAERYVRVEAIDNDGRRLFTQPLWL